MDDDRTAALADAYSLLSSGTSALLSLERRRCAFRAQPVVLTEGENAVGCFIFLKDMFRVFALPVLQVFTL